MVDKTDNLIKVYDPRSNVSVLTTLYTIEPSINSYAIIVLAICVAFLVLIIAYFVTLILCSKRNVLNRNDTINVYLKGGLNVLRNEEDQSENNEVIVNFVTANKKKSPPVQIPNTQTEIVNATSSNIQHVTRLAQKPSSHVKVIIEDETENSKIEEVRVIPKLQQSEASFNSSVADSYQSSAAQSNTNPSYIANDIRSSHETTLWSTNSDNNLQRSQLNLVQDDNSQALSIQTKSLSNTSIGNSSIKIEEKPYLTEAEKPYENKSVISKSPVKSVENLSVSPSMISKSLSNNSSALTAGNITIYLKEGEQPFENDSIWTTMKPDQNKSLNSNISVKQTQSGLTNLSNNSMNNSVLTSDNITIHLKEGENPFENDSVWTTPKPDQNQEAISENSKVESKENVSDVLVQVKEKLETVNETVNTLVRAISSNRLDLLDQALSSVNLENKPSKIRYNLFVPTVQIRTGELDQGSNELDRDSFEIRTENSELIEPLVSKTLKKSQTELNLNDIDYSSLGGMTLSKSLDSIGSKQTNRESIDSDFTIKTVKSTKSVNNMSNYDKNSRLEYQGPIINSIKSNQSSVASSNLSTLESDSLLSSSSSKSSSLVKERIQKYETKNKIVVNMKYNLDPLNNLGSRINMSRFAGDDDDTKYKLEKVSSSADY